jgi:hypothetical protein
VRAALPLLLLAPIALGGCLGVETTQDRSARKSREARTRLATQKGLSIGSINRQITVEQAAVVQDPNGIAAVVRLKNAGGAQTGVPVAITVQDRKGTKLFANDAPGLEPALVSMPALQKGEDAFWVNNQIIATGKAAKLEVKVGDPKARPAVALPRIATSGITLGHDQDGAYAHGIVSNESDVVQKRLTIFCVAVAGTQVEAAGRAVIDRLLPAKQNPKKPTKFTVYFIGTPKRGDLRCAAPPTTLPGGTK